MSALASSPVLRGAHVPAPRLPRLPQLRLVGGAARRPPLRAPAPSAARSPERAPAPLRLTRRGRGVVGLAVTAAVAVPALCGHLATSAGTPVPEPAASSVARVAAGGTGPAVWSAGSVEAERVAAGLSAAPAGWTVVRAVPGDSLWAIAGRSGVGVDRRDLVSRIVARNGLIGTEITAGDALLVPTA